MNEVILTFIATCKLYTLRIERHIFTTGADDFFLLFLSRLLQDCTAGLIQYFHSIKYNLRINFRLPTLQFINVNWFSVANVFRNKCAHRNHSNCDWCYETQPYLQIGQFVTQDRLLFTWLKCCLPKQWPFINRNGIFVRLKTLFATHFYVLIVCCQSWQLETYALTQSEIIFLSHVIYYEDESMSLTSDWVNNSCKQSSSFTLYKYAFIFFGNCSTFAAKCVWFFCAVWCIFIFN